MRGLSAALIVRNEERHLAGCLESVRGLVDEVVIVDTGSEDRTPEIAREHGARLFFEPWRDDFALARNAALSRATGDWILYVDADERVEVYGDVSASLARAGAVAATVGFHAGRGLTPYPELRFFRRRPDIRFRGVIHETIRYDVDAAVERGERIVEAPVTIRHLGYEGDRRAKYGRDLPLLQRAVVERPERIYLWHALGEAELGLGRPGDALASWRQGLEVVRREPARRIHILLYADLLGLHFDGGPLEVEDHAELVEECLARHPEDPLALWFHAQELASTGERARAREVLDRLQLAEPTGPQGVPVGYDRHLFRGLAWGLMGSCWLADGDPGRALEWLARAAEDCPDNLEIRSKHALAAAMLSGGERGIAS